MLWTPGGRSPNLEDRRSTGGGMGRGLGIGGTVVVLALSLLFGRNLFNDLGVEPGVAASGAPMSAADSAAEEPEVQFISFVLDDVQNTWAKILPNSGTRFHPARLVLFRNSTDSGCGPAQSVMGPFYCPIDERAASTWIPLPMGPRPRGLNLLSAGSSRATLGAATASPKWRAETRNSRLYASHRKFTGSVCSERLDGEVRDRR
jgi:hypothetical protein